MSVGRVDTCEFKTGLVESSFGRDCKLKDTRSEFSFLNLHLEIANYQFAIAFPHRPEAKPSLESSERTVIERRGLDLLSGCVPKRLHVTFVLRLEPRPPMLAPKSAG